MTSTNSQTVLEGVSLKTSLAKPLLMKLMEKRKPFLLKGAPGVGKTDLVTEAAAASGMDIIVCHPVTSDPTDAKGMPWVNEGEANFLPIGDLRKMVNAKVPTVVFLDDLGQAAPLVQASFMHLLLARHVGEHKVSEHVTFAAATNRKSDKAAVSGILEPVKSRFTTIIELAVDPDAWYEWANRNDLPHELISYVRWKGGGPLVDFKPSADITNTPSPRTLASAGEIMKWGLPDYTEFVALAGAIGQGEATHLHAYIKMARELPTVEAIIKEPAKIKMPDKPDVLYALSGALSRRSDMENFSNIMIFVERMPKEFQVITVMDTIRRDAVIRSKHEAYLRWGAKNIDFIA